METELHIGGHKAVVSFDNEIGMFRGEFIELGGGADFYAKSIEALTVEGQVSLRVYFDLSREYAEQVTDNT